MVNKPIKYKLSEKLIVSKKQWSLLQYTGLELHKTCNESYKTTCCLTI